MDYNEFKQLANGIKSYFGQKVLNDGRQMDDWYEGCRYIPAVAIKAIKEHIHAMDSMPRNLPKAIKEAWQIYKNQNPGKTTRVKTNCRLCRGSGYLMLERYERSVASVRRAVTRCGECDAWRNDFGQGIPIHNEAQAIACGYLVV